MSRKRKPHIKIDANRESLPFTPISGGGSKSHNIPKRDRTSHGEYLEKQFKKIWDQEVEERQKVSSISRRDGVYLQFRGQKNHELIVKSLEDARQNVRICNVKKENDTQVSTVFVPYSKKDFFLRKINKYKTSEKGTDVVASIESINKAMVKELWTDEADLPADKKVPCEIWLSVYKNETPTQIVEDFFRLCDELGIGYYKNYIEFPERAVVSVMANLETLKMILLNNPNVAEFRKNRTPVTFFTRENSYDEQQEWVQDLLKRISFNDSDISICILDKGINNAHPLISPVLHDEDMHTIFDDRIVQDISSDGHGTGMAGIAAYFNLEKALESNNKYDINHKLESVRFVDEKIDNEVSLYADVTSQAISMVEATNPNAKRVFAMPVTTGCDFTADKKDKNLFGGDGKPTSWSAGIDNLALGNYSAEETDSRLIIVSAGNTSCYEIEEADDYKAAVQTHSVENPGQSWNALTVGAFTEKANLSSDPSERSYVPLVEPGSYSPITSSSLMWDKKWPVKPEIVLEGGNIGYSKDARDNKYDTFEHLELLTANGRFHKGKLFTTINGTSSAAAQAANLAAKILENYPNLWPQTIKALMVHSASWTDAMKRQVFGDEDFHTLSKTQLRQLLRIVGYGKPNIEEALYSFNNSVSLIIEDEIQPFIKSGSSIKINEMNLHEIPWPAEILQDLGPTPVKMRVTLSYFIDPSPGEIGWENKYKYPGCRLYFDVNNINEERKEFLYRINKKIRENEDKKGNYSNNERASDRWLLGNYSRDVGSIHSDLWEGTAADLAESRYIAVYPGGGWWKERAFLKKYNSSIRYALIVSISTPDEHVDLYTPIQNKVNIAARTPIKTEISYK